MRYFLGVARIENIHKASEKLHVSAGSLSKAITRLEGELGVKLFSREGRNIKLTGHGKLLQKRAAEIIALEEAAQLEVKGHKGAINITIAAPEVLLTHMGVRIAQLIKTKYPLSVFEFIADDEQATLKKVMRGDVHLGLVTAAQTQGLNAKNITDVKFQTYVGEGHPLFEFAMAKKTVSVEDVLKYPFASPNNPILGKVGAKQSLDGWRDDQFPRKIEYLTSSLSLLERLVVSGKAVAYLPDYFGKNMKATVLKITGCPYSCVQKVRLVARNPKETGWMNSLF